MIDSYKSEKCSWSEFLYKWHKKLGSYPWQWKNLISTNSRAQMILIYGKSRWKCLLSVHHGFSDSLDSEILESPTDEKKITDMDAKAHSEILLNLGDEFLGKLQKKFCPSFLEETGRIASEEIPSK